MKDVRPPEQDPGKSFLGDTSGWTMQEKYEHACRVLVVQKKAAERNDEIIEKLTNQIEQMKRELRSTQAQLESAQQSMNLISQELAKGHQASEREVHRLRTLCQENGISPDA